MTPYIWKKLLLPLLFVEAGIFVVLLLTNKFDVPSLLLNVFSEFIGILITVALVDQVLTQHEAEKWKNVKSKVSCTHCIITPVKGNILLLALAELFIQASEM